MTLRRNVENVASNFESVTVKSKLPPHREIQILVKYAPHRWEVKLVVKTASAKEWDIISGPVVCYEARELSNVIQELFAKGPVESVTFDVPGEYGTLQYFGPARFNAIRKHVAKASV